MIVLGLETSCDETAAAVVRDDRTILANVVLSQLDEHAPYGGVVPEIAARAHVEHLDRLTAQAMAEAGIGFDDLDGVAATAGPGLIGGVMVGLMTAKAIAAARQTPFIAVNHLEAHALTVRLVAEAPFPYLLLLVSGGHCQLLEVVGVGRYRRLGSTIDDAVGEAFDKTAKMLGLGYPGGPAVEQAAEAGDADTVKLPRPLHGRPGLDFSFSGLKNAVRLTVAGQEAPLDAASRADIAAGFQAAVADHLGERGGRAMDWFAERHKPPHRFVVAGGVAANRFLRNRFAALAAARGFELLLPPVGLCTDNGAMVAWAGLERLRLGMTDGLDATARARWPLDEATGKQGAVQ